MIHKLLYISCLLIIGTLSMATVQSSDPKIDSLIKVTDNAPDDSNQVKNLLTISSHYLRFNHTLSLKYCNKALEISNKIGYSNGIINSSYQLGKIFYMDDNYDLAYQHFSEASYIAAKIGDNKALAKNKANIGIMFYKRGNYSKALEFILESLKISESIGDLKSTANSYNLIGSIYSSQKDSVESLKYFQKNLSIAQKLNDTLNIAQAYNNIATNYFENKNFPKALEYFKRSLEIKIKLNDNKGLGYAFNSIGACYLKEKKIKDAYDNIMKGLDIRLKEGHKLGIVQSYQTIGSFYYDQNNYKAAIDYFQKALKLAQEIDALEEIKSISENLFIAYNKTGQTKTALEYHVIFKKFSDSLFNESNVKKLTQLEMQFDFDKKLKIKEIEQIKKEAQAQAVIKHQKIVTTFSLIALSLVVILIFVLLRSYRIKKLANSILLEKNKQILEQTSDILEKNEELQQQKEEITLQAELLEKTNLELGKLSIVASKTENAIVFATPSGKIEWVNAAFESIYGYTLKEFFELKGDNLCTSSNNSHIEEILKECIASKSSVIYSSQCTTKEGQNIWVQTTLTPVMDEQKNIVQLIAVDSDITIVKNAEKEIERQNKDITDSMNYASRIQEALRPDEKFFSTLIPEHFVINIPRDIVSGDFYWLANKDQKNILCVANCTGPGIPGAFMSVLGIAYLKEILHSTQAVDAAEILMQLRKKVNDSLYQYKKDGESADTMETALCIFDIKNKQIQFAGANKGLFLVRQNELIEIEPDKFPIGISDFMEEPFTNRTIIIEPGDLLYLFTNIYNDQFGSDTDTKISGQQFSNLLLENHTKSMNEQKNNIDHTFHKWSGHKKQAGDILVIGIKIT